MDPSTFWKVLWLISFCRIFDVIAIFLLFWLIFLNEKVRNFIYDKVGYDYVVGGIGNLGKATLIKAVIFIVIMIVAYAALEPGQTESNCYAYHKYTQSCHKANILVDSKVIA
jgi:hypothetical protein